MGLQQMWIYGESRADAVSSLAAGTRGKVTSARHTRDH